MAIIHMLFAAIKSKELILSGRLGPLISLYIAAKMHTPNRTIATRRDI